MRRGHSGVSGWRGGDNHNLRHFRPRGSGTPNFRPSRPFALMDLPPRFPPPSIRQYRGPRSYGQHVGHLDNIPQQEHHDRNKYRINNVPRSQDRGYHNQRQMPPYQLRQNDNDHRDRSYGESIFYKNSNQCHVNTLGDIDHRPQHSTSPWAIPPPAFDSNRQYYDDLRSPQKTPRNFNMGDDWPTYSGHRPPASDHYTTTTGPNNNNSQYTHSVDDTVDIIRKRLQNRGKSSDSFMEHQSNMEEDLRKNTDDHYPEVFQEVPLEQPVKKRIPKQKQNIKLNCSNMKNKIVHQLFKMDKVKIHKLMDNPSSSSKFEYAISSLITEGQNSLLKHQRSVAEKSLCSSSADFIQDDTNTIYEDTFMKQMQDVLDPQDTVLLEDIKPLVMAELSRVLHLDEYQFELMQDHGIQDSGMQDHGIQDLGMQDHGIQDSGMLDHGVPNSGMQDQITQDYGMPDQDTKDQIIQDYGMPDQDTKDQIIQDYEMPDQDTKDQIIQDYGMPDQDTKDQIIQDYGIIDQEPQDQRIQGYGMQDPGLEMQEPEILPKNEPTNYPYFDEEIHDTDQYSQEVFNDQNQISAANFNNIEITTNNLDVNNECESTYESKPLFERQPTDMLSHTENRFSENRQLRNSTEKSVEHDQNQLIRDSSRDYVSPIPVFDPNAAPVSDDDDTFAEFDKQYHVAVDRNFIENENASRPPSPAQLFVCNCDETNFSMPNVKIEMPSDAATSINIIKEVDTEVQDIVQSPAKVFTFVTKTDIGVRKESEHSLEKENLSASSFKTHKAERVTHGEPGKKKEAVKLETSGHTKSVLQSNTRKRCTDQKPSHRKEKRKRSSQSESQEVVKSIVNIFAKETPKVSKKAGSTEKTYSDKYVKRKESHKKTKEKDFDDSKNQNHVSSHSNFSPKDSLSNETSKSDPKVKLKPIDMFGEHTKKGNIRQSHRNTATALAGKSPVELVPKPVIPTVTSFARKLSRKHSSTQVILKVRNRDSQTDKVKQCVKQTQTAPESTTKISNLISKIVATNPLERMKEIDMEIQLLLQEKFKLYNSIETKSAETVPIDSIPSLSMRVFKVNTEPTDEKSNDLQDAIVNDFTSIPTEELEQIALESIKDEQILVKPNKKSRRHKVSELAHKSSMSPTTRRYKNKSPKSPSISLIERIITDDRPIEDIISLDDYEDIPVKPKKKPHKPVLKKKTSKKTKPPKPSTADYDIKECSVVIEHVDMSYYLRPKSEEPSIDNASQSTFDLSLVPDNLTPKPEECSFVVKIIQEQEEIESQTQAPEPSMLQVVEDVVNDLQFDMLDVSEDIIIGDSCEVKADDKSSEREIITEDIILDNSQSSMDEGLAETPEVEIECKMYNYSTNENLRRDAITIIGADAVLAIERLDDDFIVACQDGNVYHFNSDGQLLNTLRGMNQAVTCLTIIKEKYGTIVYTGSLDSRIRCYDLETGMENGPECNVLSPIQSMDRAWNIMFVGTRTGHVMQFHCKDNMLIPIRSVRFSQHSILALHALKEGPRKVLLVAAKAESSVTIKDAQSGLLLRTLQGPAMSVYSLMFEDGKVYCGTSSNKIHVFDYSSGNHMLSHKSGNGAVCLRASGGLLFAGCYDGCVYVYREGEVRALAQLRGPSPMLLSIAIHGRKIIAGYQDKGLYIWKMPLAIVQEMIF